MDRNPFGRILEIVRLVYADWTIRNTARDLVVSRFGRFVQQFVPRFGFGARMSIGPTVHPM